MTFANIDTLFIDEAFKLAKSIASKSPVALVGTK
jgi:hypothetical protein